jgi:hypothetical protein
MSGLVLVYEQTGYYTRIVYARRIRPESSRYIDYVEGTVHSASVAMKDGLLVCKIPHYGAARIDALRGRSLTALRALSRDIQNRHGPGSTS